MEIYTMPQSPNLRRNAICAGLSLALGSAAGTSIAQEIALEEVLVTATKRSVNLQDVALSVSAISGEQLTELGVINVTDMEKTAPGLKIRYVGNTPSLVMRGAGSAGTTDLAVPIYNDGLYRPLSIQGLASYLDVDRVEVLRGPQGTLFGRNTLGGLLNIITTKPNTQELEFGAAVTLGDYDLQKFEGFVNIPLGDSVAFRLTGSDTTRDPYVENTYDKSGGLKDADETYFRGQLSWDISDTVNLNLTAGYWEDTANGSGDFGHKVIGIPVNPETQQTNGVSGILDERKGLRDGWGGGKDKNGSVSNGDESAFLTGDNREIAMDYRPNRDLEEDSFSALLNWDLGFAQLKAHVGYADFESHTRIDGDFSTVGSYRTDTLGSGWVSGEWQTNESWQADINLNSTGDGRLHWTLGYFWFDEEETYAWLFGDTHIGAPQQITWAHWLHSAGEYETESQAIYGQAEYDITDDLMLTAGLRYSEDERSTRSLYPDLDTLDNDFPRWIYEDQTGWKDYQNEKGDDDHTDYRLSLQYNLNDDMMIYGSVATGYISGDSTSSGGLLDPSEVDSYELGFRSTLLDGRMTLNATYYYADYEGLTTSLLTINDQGFAVAETVPGGGMNSEGIEAEMNWQLTENLLLTSAVSFDFSEFDEFLKKNAYTEDDGLADDQGYFDLEGDDTPFSPDFTMNLGLSYQLPLGDLGHLVPGIFVYYSDDYRTFSAPYAWAEQDSYTTVDLTATWYSPSDSFSVQAFVNNATDEDVITGSDSYSGARAVVDFNNPRVWGVRAAYNF
jgi:iron complex outermembrane recepter protein